MLKYEDVILEDSDIDTLQGQCFLTDQVISFYFAYLSSSFKTDDILLVTPTMSLYLANCNDDKAVSDFTESCKLSTKKLVLFTVNDCEDFEGGDSGTHWSTLVYESSMNAFVHFDTTQFILDVNSSPDKKLYDVVKNYVGSGGLPEFVEWEETPQQSNGYDCGVYILSTAKVICHWFLHEDITEVDMFAAVAKEVDHKVEDRMRTEVLDIIQQLSKAEMDKDRRLNDGMKLMRSAKDYTVELPDEKDVTNFLVEFKAPDSSLYEGYWFKVSVKLGDEYPSKPPIVIFKTKILHPNIERTCRYICHPCLGDEWSDIFELALVFEMILPDLLRDPDKDNPWDVDDTEMMEIFNMPEEKMKDKIQEHCEKPAIKRPTQKSKYQQGVYSIDNKSNFWIYNEQKINN